MEQIRKPAEFLLENVKGKKTTRKTVSQMGEQYYDGN
jgi:hypothetical protein